MRTLKKLEIKAANVLRKEFKLGEALNSLITEYNADSEFNTSTPTGASPTVPLAAGAKSCQIIAAHGTAPTGAITLLLPELAETIGREFTVINNSVLTVTVKGKAADAGIAIATIKTAKILVLAGNVTKRITADI